MALENDQSAEKGGVRPVPPAVIPASSSIPEAKTLLKEGRGSPGSVRRIIRLIMGSLLLSGVLYAPFATHMRKINGPKIETVKQMVASINLDKILEMLEQFRAELAQLKAQKEMELGGSTGDKRKRIEFEIGTIDFMLESASPETHTMHTHNLMALYDSLKSRFAFESSGFDEDLNGAAVNTMAIHSLIVYRLRGLARLIDSSAFDECIYAVPVPGDQGKSSSAEQAIVSIESEILLFESFLTLLEEKSMWLRSDNGFMTLFNERSGREYRLMDLFRADFERLQTIAHFLTLHYRAITEGESSEDRERMAEEDRRCLEEGEKEREKERRFDQVIEDYMREKASESNTPQ